MVIINVLGNEMGGVIRINFAVSIKQSPRALLLDMHRRCLWLLVHLVRGNDH